MEEIISKAATLVEALPYIQRFRSQIFVVKYGGSFMDSPDLEERHRVARDIVFLEAEGINPEVVKTIQDFGGKARGFNGTDIFRCQKLQLVEKDEYGRDVDLGSVGEVS